MKIVQMGVNQNVQAVVGCIEVDSDVQLIEALGIVFG